MSDPKLLHRVIRRLAGWAVWSFFTELHVIGGENVPKNGPIIVCVLHFPECYSVRECVGLNPKWPFELTLGVEC